MLYIIFIFFLAGCPSVNKEQAGNYPSPTQISPNESAVPKRLDEATEEQKNLAPNGKESSPLPKPTGKVASEKNDPPRSSPQSDSPLWFQTSPKPSPHVSEPPPPPLPRRKGAMVVVGDISIFSELAVKNALKTGTNMDWDIITINKDPKLHPPETYNCVIGVDRLNTRLDAKGFYKSVFLGLEGRKELWADRPWGILIGSLPGVVPAGDLITELNEYYGAQNLGHPQTFTVNENLGFFNFAHARDFSVADPLARKEVIDDINIRIITGLANRICHN